MRILVSLGLVASFPLLGAGPPANPRPPAATRTAPTSDAELEKAILARFARSKISVEKFRVTVQGGVATIQGKTQVIQRKGTATRLAKLAGAKSVRNLIEISQEAKDKATQQLDQGRRRAQVKRSEAQRQ